MADLDFDNDENPEEEEEEEEEMLIFMPAIRTFSDYPLCTDQVNPRTESRKDGGFDGQSDQSSVVVSLWGFLVAQYSRTYKRMFNPAGPWPWGPRCVQPS